MKKVEIIKKGMVVGAIALCVSMNFVSDVKAGNETAVINSQGRFLYTDEASGKTVLLDAADFNRLNSQITNLDTEVSNSITEIEKNVTTISNSVTTINNNVTQLKSNMNVKVDKWDESTQSLYLVPVE